ncbi:MAG: MaoC family dehydratase [Deltaproteobacteria bacterium HGW-Deltaproteobacteria-13]|jgi:acyl dehydratase|nr:MAG: MaoC family dehydratase [Deltaproteobacteria bacterium HGW-Deltaproteobacteria-13]
MMADKSKLGMEFPVYTFTIEKDKIVEFAIAISQKDSREEINPIYYDEEAAKKAGYQGIPAPPTFATSSFFWTGGGLIGTVKTLGIDLNKLLDREEEYEYYGSIYAGDVITRKMKVVDMYRKGKGKRTIDVTVLETELINQRGELVVKYRSTLMEI